MFAPVLVSVYNRQRHLEMCIDSLKLNPCSMKTDLYVVSDAAHTREMEPDIESIRRYISSIDGFKNVFPIFREKNLGGFLSINTAIDYVLEKHGRVIFIEDDNIVSENFLAFMNQGLDYYNDDPSVFSISGYNFPVSIPKDYPYDIYKWQGFTAWGVGLWHLKWEKVDWNREWIDSFLADNAKVEALNNVGEHVLLYYLAERKKKKEITTDIVISIHLVNNNLFSIFPVVSTVRNMGHDGMGEHGGITDKYMKQIIDSYRDYKWIKNIVPSPVINKILRRHFRNPLSIKIASIIPESIKSLIKSIIY